MGQASSRGERHRLARKLRADGKTFAEIAEVLRDRFSVSARAAMRLAHCWTQERARDEWELRWPDRPKDKKWFSYQERWPNGGRAPSLPDLHKLAELYQCAVADLLTDLSYTDLDPATKGVEELAGRDPDHLTPPEPSPSRQSRLAQTGSEGPSPAVVVALDTRNDDEVDRREFTTGAVLAALALASGDS